MVPWMFPVAATLLVAAVLTAGAGLVWLGALAFSAALRRRSLG
jgi:membrane protein implicated in regulation of membrane protease activity